jgi:hypothetical protein
MILDYHFFKFSFHKILIFFFLNFFFQISLCEIFGRSSNSQTTKQTNNFAHYVKLLQWVSESYNDLSWLTIDPITTRRRSVFPIHILIANRVSLLLNGFGV